MSHTKQEARCSVSAELKITMKTKWPDAAAKEPLPLECPTCGHLFQDCEQVDICDNCAQDFGDCDGSCGDPICGNQHCQHCGNNIYNQCCPECREVLPVHLWVGEGGSENAKVRHGGPDGNE